MIRRDYILRLVEQFLQALSRIQGFKKEQRWDDADVALDEEFQRLIKQGAEGVGSLSLTELLSRLIEGEPTQAVQMKTFMLVTLLQQAGDLAIAQNQIELGKSHYLKGLHLLLHTLAGSDIQDYPEFVPKVEIFVAVLKTFELPIETLGTLMQHYERTGEFAKAEDALFDMLDQVGENVRILQFGIAFYERLLELSDDLLEVGDLPRLEVESSLTELRRKLTLAAL
jgi:hypothetical protein